MSKSMGHLLFDTTSIIAENKAKFIDDFVRESAPKWLVWIAMKTKSKFGFDFFGYRIEIQENIQNFGCTIYLLHKNKYVAKRNLDLTVNF